MLFYLFQHIFKQKVCLAVIEEKENESNEVKGQDELEEVGLTEEADRLVLKIVDDMQKKVEVDKR